MATATTNKKAQKALPLPPSLSTELIPNTPAISRPNLLAIIDVGLSLSVAQRLEFDSTTKVDIDLAMTNLKGTMSKAAGLAAARSGNKYITEVGTFNTRSGDIIVTAVVTRVS